MIIDQWENASGLFMGLAGFDSEAKKTTRWVGERLQGIADSLWTSGANAIKTLSELASKAKNAAKGFLDFMIGWFKDDPIAATAGSAAVILTGAIVITTGGAIAPIAGGAIAAVSKVASLVAPLGAIVKGGLSLKGAATLLLGGAAVFSVKRFLVDGLYRMYNFDWNVTDQAYAAMQKSLFESLAGQLGESLGTSVAALVCSSNPTINGVEVNVDLLSKAYYLMQDEDSDARDGVIDAFTDLIYFTRYVSKQLLFINSYTSARRWVRENIRFGIKSIDDAIKGWGTTNQSWSFRSEVEERIESIDNAMLQNFTEELVDSFIDSCYKYAMQ